MDNLIDTEAFRELLSKKLGVEFVSRVSLAHFLVNIQAFPKKLITDSELFVALKECCEAEGFAFGTRPNSIAIRGDFTWFLITKENQEFALGITNTVLPPVWIIITLSIL